MLGLLPQREVRLFAVVCSFLFVFRNTIKAPFRILFVFFGTMLLLEK